MSRADALHAVTQLAADQWGLLTSAQAKARGASSNDLSRLRSDQIIRQVRHGIYALAGAPASPLEAVRAEWLATDPERTVSERSHDETPVVLCDETAAAIYGIGDLTTGYIQFNSGRRLQTRQDWVRVSNRALATAEWHLVDGLPVTTPRRTLEDLAASGRWDADQIGAAINDAVGMNLLPKDEVGRSRVLVQAAPQLATPARNASVLAKLNDDARRRRVNPQHAQGDFFRFMFIHQLMETQPGWVLKGGTGLLCRYRDARSTQDLDLFRTTTEGSAASAAAITTAMNAARVGDYTFLCSEPHTSAQENIDVTRVDVEVLGGGRRVGQFHIDVSARVILSREPDTIIASRPDDALLPGYPNRIKVRLYPVENQIADKVCAMYDTYSGSPSTRYRDLYDLAVLAENERPVPGVMAEALSVQGLRRRLILPTRMVAPTERWPAEYNQAARRMEGAREPWRDFDSALSKVASVVDPALAILAGQSGDHDMAHRTATDTTLPDR